MIHLVYLFPVTVARSTRWWLVSRSGGRQMRGCPDEKLTDVIAQWEATYGEIDKLEREKAMTFKEAEERIAELRRAYYERKAVKESQ